MLDIELTDVHRLDPFDFRWPDGIESFEGGWSFIAQITGTQHAGRHGIGTREVYGRLRVHTVTGSTGRSRSKASRQTPGQPGPHQPPAAFRPCHSPHLARHPRGLRRIRHRRSPPRD